MKRLEIALASLCLALVACASAPRRAEAAYPAPIARLTVRQIDAPGDSIGYRISWSPPSVGPEQLPLANYDVQLLVGGQTVLASTQTPQVQATLTIARPPVGDSIGPVTARVRARDTGGQVSVWVNSEAWTIRRPAEAPGAPTGISVDTVVAVQARGVRSLSLWAVSDSVGCVMVNMRDGRVLLRDGDQIHRECVSALGVAREQARGGPETI